MSDALINARFELLMEMLDDLEIVADKETADALRAETEELKQAYISAFQTGRESDD